MATREKDIKKKNTAVQGLLRSIPKVDEFLGWVAEDCHAPISVVKDAVRATLESVRQDILASRLTKKGDLTRKKLYSSFEARLNQLMTPNLRRMLNATGVVVHTNLGRSLLPKQAVESLLTAATRYSNLEFDLTTGKRGSRYSLVEDLLCRLTGAESALVVNNNAAAVLLVLETLAKGREVIVSRGQLVEIGGSFRIPEVMEKSGARLVEVGATNRTHLKDYQIAINEETALLLKVHSSNFKVIGFTKEVENRDLVELGHEHDLLVVEDLGSGSLLDYSRFGLEKEPTVSEVVDAGVDVVTFSGDKLLGGPQAGIILGKKEIVDRVKQNPMNRALRIDKFTLAALEAVLRLYFDEEQARKTLPTPAMLTMDYEAIQRRAQRLLRRLKKNISTDWEMKTIKTESRVGGGALPEQGLMSRAVLIYPMDRTINTLEKQLREATVPVIGRIEDDRMLLDMRTVADDEVPLLAETLTAVFKAQTA